MEANPPVDRPHPPPSWKAKVSCKKAGVGGVGVAGGSIPRSLSDGPGNEAKYTLTRK